MKAKDVMTPNPACCTPETNLQEVAQMFVDHDCGAIPVVEDSVSRRPVGIITDRDIACRAVAAGKNALELRARDCMSTACVTVPLEASLDDCVGIRRPLFGIGAALHKTRGFLGLLPTCGQVPQRDVYECPRFQTSRSWLVWQRRVR